MFCKLRTNFFSKNLFSLLIAASLAVHALIIFFSPQANSIFSLRSLRESFVRESDEYAVVLELEDPESQKKITDPDAKQNEGKLKKEEEAKKKKYKIFTDTSDNTDDEDAKVDTDKIGEKGSIAKDYLPDSNQAVNNEPYSAGQTKAPLLGKAEKTFPATGKQQPQEQETNAQAFIPEDTAHDKNSPARHADLPQGIEKEGESARSVQMQLLPNTFREKEQSLSGGSKETETEVKTVKQAETTQAENITQTLKRAQTDTGHGIRQDEEVLQDSNREGILFTDKHGEINRESETKEASLTTPIMERGTVKKDDLNDKKSNETNEAKNTMALKPELPAPPSGLSDIEPQRRLERGLDEQESPEEIKPPKVSFNVNAKEGGSGKEPALFEDTISNAAIPGAPSFNVKKHEYGAYFKHIRERISLYWFLGYGTRAEIKLETQEDKPIIIEFKVLPDGAIDEVKIVDDAGNSHLAFRLVSSIKNAAPLNPFPDDIKEPAIDVRFNFYFF